MPAPITWLSAVVTAAMTGALLTIRSLGSGAANSHPASFSRDPAASRGAVYFPRLRSGPPGVRSLLGQCFPARLLWMLLPKTENSPGLGGRNLKSHPVQDVSSSRAWWRALQLRSQGLH